MIGIGGALVGATLAIIAFTVEIVTAKHFPPFPQADWGSRFDEPHHLPPLPKEFQKKFDAEKKKGMPDTLAWCRATSSNDDDIDDCIVILSHN